MMSSLCQRTEWMYALNCRHLGSCRTADSCHARLLLCGDMGTCMCLICCPMGGTALVEGLYWRTLRQLSLEARHEEALQRLHAPLQLPVLVCLHLPYITNVKCYIPFHISMQRMVLTVTTWATLMMSKDDYDMAHLSTWKKQGSVMGRAQNMSSQLKHRCYGQFLTPYSFTDSIPPYK